MKIIMVRKKQYRTQIFNKMAQQFLGLRRYLCIKPWQHWFKTTKPWFLVLAQSDVLSQRYFEILKEKTLWNSLVHEYSDAWPMVNLRVSESAVFIDVPAAFWRNSGVKVLGVLSRWLSFLKLLGKHRYLQPLNGVILLLDFKLLADEVELKKYLLQLQTVLIDASAQSLAGMPIYVMIDGVEEVQGFHAYMAKLQGVQREQMFGLSDVNDFEALLAQLDQKTLAQLSREKEVLHNSELLRFVPALGHYQKTLKDFCAVLNSVGVGCRKLFLRGVYFVDFLDDLFVQVPTRQLVKEAPLGGFRLAWFRWCEFYKKKILWRVGLLALAVLMILTVAGIWKLERHVEPQHGWAISVTRFNDVNSALNAVQNLQMTWQQLIRKPQHNEPKAVVDFVALHGNEVNQALQGIAASLSSAQNSSGLIHLSTQLLNQQALAFGQLQKLSVLAPLEVQDVFNVLLHELTSVVFAATENGMTNLWASQMRGLCRANLVGFPFQKESALEASMINFNKVFSPSGALGEMNASLLPLWQAFSGHHSAYGVGFVWPLENLALMNLISTTFLNQGRVSVNLQWTPLLLSKNLAKFNLSVGNATLMYQNGPRFAQNVVWSFGMPVVLSFTDLAGHSYSQTYGGSWALLRLFNQAQVHKLSSNHYQVSFVDGAYSATYLVQAHRGDFAGVLAVLGFRCD